MCDRAKKLVSWHSNHRIFAEAARARQAMPRSKPYHCTLLFGVTKSQPLILLLLLKGNIYLITWVFDSIAIQIAVFLQKQHVLDRQCQDQNPTIAHCSRRLLKAHSKPFNGYKIELVQDNFLYVPKFKSPHFCRSSTCQIGNANL